MLQLHKSVGKKFAINSSKLLIHSKFIKLVIGHLYRTKNYHENLCESVDICGKKQIFAPHQNPDKHLR